MVLIAPFVLPPPTPATVAQMVGSPWPPPHPLHESFLAKT